MARARREARYDEAARLHGIGASISRISVELGADRKTVRGWLRLGQAPSGSARPATASSIPSRPFSGVAGARGVATAPSSGVNS